MVRNGITSSYITRRPGANRLGSFLRGGNCEFAKQQLQLDKGYKWAYLKRGR